MLLATLAKVTTTTVDLDPPGNITNQEAALLILILLLVGMVVAGVAFAVMEGSR